MGRLSESVTFSRCSRPQFRLGCFTLAGRVGLLLRAEAQVVDLREVLRAVGLFLFPRAAHLRVHLAEVLSLEHAALVGAPALLHQDGYLALFLARRWVLPLDLALLCLLRLLGGLLLPRLLLRLLLHLLCVGPRLLSGGLLKDLHPWLLLLGGFLRSLGSLDLFIVLFDPSEKALAAVFESFFLFLFLIRDFAFVQLELTQLSLLLGKPQL